MLFSFSQKCENPAMVKFQNNNEYQLMKSLGIVVPESNIEPEPMYEYDFKTEELWFTIRALSRLLGESRQNIIYHGIRMGAIYNTETIIRLEGKRTVQRRVQIASLYSATRICSSFLSHKAIRVSRRMSQLLAEDGMTKNKQFPRKRIIIDP